MVSRSTSYTPSWWSEERHGSAWSRVKEALRRDWEQTKNDLTRGRKGADLDQDVGDTVKQAAGRESTISASAPVKTSVGTEDWNTVEPAYRYGFGAAHQYKDDREWNPAVESKLSREWNDLKSGRTWEEMKDFVRRGWNAGRKPTTSGAY